MFPDVSAYKKLLCLDGGGVRGISSVMILQAIMEEIERIEDGPSAVTDQTKRTTTVTTSRMGSNERKPIDYFDLTGGTSTGGIIAVMLSRLGMNCTDAIEVYKSISSDIFAVHLAKVHCRSLKSRMSLNLHCSRAARISGVRREMRHAWCEGKCLPAMYASLCECFGSPAEVQDFSSRNLLRAVLGIPRIM